MKPRDPHSELLQSERARLAGEKSEHPIAIERRKRHQIEAAEQHVERKENAQHHCDSLHRATPGAVTICEVETAPGRKARSAESQPHQDGGDDAQQKIGGGARQRHPGGAARMRWDQSGL